MAIISPSSNVWVTLKKSASWYYFIFNHIKPLLLNPKQNSDFNQTLNRRQTSRWSHRRQFIQTKTKVVYEGKLQIASIKFQRNLKSQYPITETHLHFPGIPEILNIKKAEDESSALNPGGDRLTGHIDTQITAQSRIWILAFMIESTTL